MFDCVFHNKFKRWIPIRLVEGTTTRIKWFNWKTGYLTANLTISEFNKRRTHCARLRPYPIWVSTHISALIMSWQRVAVFVIKSIINKSLSPLLNFTLCRQLSASKNTPIFCLNRNSSWPSIVNLASLVSNTGIIILLYAWPVAFYVVVVIFVILAFIPWK
jgi:hypothetical protein